MTTGDVVYSLRFSLIKILHEPGFDLGLTAEESRVRTAKLHMLYTINRAHLLKHYKKTIKHNPQHFKVNVTKCNALQCNAML